MKTETAPTVIATSQSVEQTRLNSVQQAYLDILGRRPDSGGEHYWATERIPELLDQGLTEQEAREQVRKDIASGPEAVYIGRGVIAEQQEQYQITREVSTPSGATEVSTAVETPGGIAGNTVERLNEQLIIASYRKNLGRDPVAEEVNNWIGHE